MSSITRVYDSSGLATATAKTVAKQLRIMYGDWAPHAEVAQKARCSMSTAYEGIKAAKAEWVTDPEEERRKTEIFTRPPSNDEGAAVEKMVEEFRAERDRPIDTR